MPDYPIHLVIHGRPVSWKNSREIAGGKIIKNKRQQEWLTYAMVQLSGQYGWNTPRIPKKERLNAAIVSYLPTRQLTDADNLYGGPQDALQAAGVLEDDVSIQTHNGSDRLYDKANPRVEITLTRYEK